jgi:hypothetical protein
MRQAHGRREMITTRIAKPKDVFTREYEQWWMSLDDAAYDRECGRRYQRTEYQVRIIDEYGDSMDVDGYNTLAKARRAYDACDLGDNTGGDNPTAGVALHKARYTYEGISLDKLDEELTLIDSKGDIGDWADSDD